MRGIETVTIYDPRTEEFVINTPCESAQKYWIGEAAKVSSFFFCFNSDFFYFFPCTDFFFNYAFGCAACNTCNCDFTA